MSLLESCKATKVEVDVERKRIDSFTSLKDGSTTGDAELHDIRIGYDSTQYNTAGESVRGQIVELDRKINTLNSETKNLCNIVWEDHKYIDGQDGEIRDHESEYSVSDFIDISDFSEISITTFVSSYKEEASGFALYDENKKLMNYYLYRSHGKTEPREITRNIKLTNEKYIRLTNFLFSNKKNVKIVSVGTENHIEKFKYVDIFKTSELSYIKDTFINGNTGNVNPFDTSVHIAKYSTTDYLDIHNFINETIYVTNYLGTSNDKGCICIYSKDKKIIKTYMGHRSSTDAEYNIDVDTQKDIVPILIPENAWYLRLTTFNRGLTESQVTIQYKMKDPINKDMLPSFINDMYRLSDDDPLKYIDYSSMNNLELFLNVGCIGDSLSCGVCVESNGTSHTLPNYSCGKFMERKTGNKYYIWAQGGFKVGDWLNSRYATECFDGNHKCNAYIIALAQNDGNYIRKNSLSADSYVGTINDINDSDYSKNADTFYGRYGKIIQKIKEMQPKAKIFVMTDFLQYIEDYGLNTAIRNIANHFSNVYLVDLHKYSDMLYKEFYYGVHNTGNHYDAYGYRKMAYIVATYINWIIEKNQSDFKDIQFIDL